MKKIFTALLIMISMIGAPTSTSAQAIDNSMVQELFNVFLPELKEKQDLPIQVLLRINTYRLLGMNRDQVISRVSQEQGLIRNYCINEDVLAKATGTLWDIQFNLLPVYSHFTANREVPKAADLSDITITEQFKAPVDELYYGTGDERNEYNAYGFDAAKQAEALANGAILKHNNSYAWGMGKEGKYLYYGTCSNLLCSPEIAFLLGGATGQDLLNKGLHADCMACDFLKSHRSSEKIIDVIDGKEKAIGAYGDAYIPRIYRYDTESGITEDITPTEGDALDILRNSQGLRSATIFNKILFIGGPTLIGAGLAGAAVNFLAYDTEAGKYIATSHLDNIDGYTVSDIRRWINVNGVLYCSAALISPSGKKMGGALRWCGSKENPFKFEIIGLTHSNAAEIAYYNGRLYIGTWATEDHNIAEVYRGPKVTDGGVKPSHDYWECLWKYTDYTNRDEGMVGGFCTFDGKLMWGTLHTGYFNALNTFASYGAALMTPNGIADLIATMPTGTLWSMDDSGADKGDAPVIELLYGEESFMVNKGGTGINGQPQPNWQSEKNGMGLTPKFGRSGYGNPFMNYIWAMKEYDGKLYVGGMEDATLLKMYASVINPKLGESLYSFFEMIGLPKSKLGNDFVCFSSSSSPAEMVSDNGLGNPMAYGIRNLEIVGDAMYIGTANPYNIAETGGFQIHMLKKNSTSGIDTVPVTEPMKLIMKKNDGYVTFTATDSNFIKSVSLYDMAGRVLQTTNPESNVAYVFTDSFGKGNYIIKVTTTDGTKTVKVVM